MLTNCVAILSAGCEAPVCRRTRGAYCDRSFKFVFKRDIPSSDLHICKVRIGITDKAC